MYVRKYRATTVRGLVETDSSVRYAHQFTLVCMLALKNMILKIGV
jgi:hypothetical protein